MAAMENPADDAGTISAIRDFNRLYTRQLGLLDRGFLGSKLTLTEARVLYELAQRADVTASEIATGLHLDMGYLSRILAKFQRRWAAALRGEKRACRVLCDRGIADRARRLDMIAIQPSRHAVVGDLRAPAGDLPDV